MADIKWLPDGQKMFDKLMAAVPEGMRDAIKPKLLEMLSGKAAGQPVNGDLVVKFVEEDLPEPQRSALISALGIKKPDVQKEEAAAPVAAAASWEGNSESMFERMIQEVPDMMREMFRGKLLAVVHEKAQGDSVKEEHIMAIVNEMVPEPFKANILKAFATMGGVDLNKVEKILEQNQGGNETLISILHAVQEEFGYIPPEALLLIGEKKEVFLSTLYAMTTSYSAFRLEKPKKHIITLCNGTGCHLKGGNNVIKAVEEKIAENGADVTLEKVRCLGCCDMSPAVMIDGEVFGGVEAQAKIEAVFNE